MPGRSSVAAVPKAIKLACLTARAAVAFLLTAALALLWALPGTAGAAVQLGQTSPSNPLACNPNLNLVQRAAVTAQEAVTGRLDYRSLRRRGGNGTVSRRVSPRASAAT